MDPLCVRMMNPGSPVVTGGPILCSVGASLGPLSTTGQLEASLALACVGDLPWPSPEGSLQLPWDHPAGVVPQSGRGPEPRWTAEPPS